MKKLTGEINMIMRDDTNVTVSTPHVPEPVNLRAERLLKYNKELIKKLRIYKNITFYLVCIMLLILILK